MNKQITLRTLAIFAMVMHGMSMRADDQKILATELDVEIRNQYDSMKTDFQVSFEKFKKSYDFGEILLQQVVELLDRELAIVYTLKRGHTGAMIEEVIAARNYTLQHSAPSAAFMYDRILDLVTYDEASNRKLYTYYNNHKHITYALNWHDKRDFLENMFNKLSYYQGLMRTIQYDFAIDLSRGEDGVAVGRNGKSMNFCPVIR